MSKRYDKRISPILRGQGSKMRSNENKSKAIFNSNIAFILYIVSSSWALVSYNIYYKQYGIKFTDHINLSDLLIIFFTDVGLYYSVGLFLSILLGLLLWLFYSKTEFFRNIHNWILIPINIILIIVSLVLTLFNANNIYHFVLGLAIVAGFSTFFNFLLYEKITFKNYLLIPIVSSALFIAFTVQKVDIILDSIRDENPFIGKCLYLKNGGYIRIDSTQYYYLGSTKESLFLLEYISGERKSITLKNSKDGYKIIEEFPL